jgi:hypothetical protein
MAEEQKSALDTAREIAEAKATEVNAGRSGIGTRQVVGATRGKNPQIITYEQWDDSQPDTMPKSYEQFVEIVKPTAAQFIDFLIRGQNAALYEAASDPLAEFVVASWPAEVQSTFRQAVRNYSRGLGITLEDAVSTIRPGFVKKFGE